MACELGFNLFIESQLKAICTRRCGTARWRFWTYRHLQQRQHLPQISCMLKVLDLATNTTPTTTTNDDDGKSLCRRPVSWRWWSVPPPPRLQQRPQRSCKFVLVVASSRSPPGHRGTGHHRIHAVAGASCNTLADKDLCKLVVVELTPICRMSAYDVDVVRHFMSSNTENLIATLGRCF